MNGPGLVCAGCGNPASPTKPICDACLRATGQEPRKFCALCERALNRNSDVAAADNFGIHRTVSGGYAGKCEAAHG